MIVIASAEKSIDGLVKGMNELIYLLVACPPERGQGTINCYSQEVVFHVYSMIKGNAGDMSFWWFMYTI